MQPDTEQSLGTTPATPPRNTRRAVALLLHAAAPERRHVVLGTVWLVAAALLEALGPLLGKYFIDQYLLPPHR